MSGGAQWSERPASQATEGGPSTLWNHIFGDTPGLLAVWSGRRVPGVRDLAEPTTTYYEWPRRASAASAQLDRESDAGREAYVCAHLLTEDRRIKENAAKMLALYVDGDGAQPGPDLPQPTAVIESSPGRQQFYWRLTKAIDPKQGEQLNKRLAYAMGADKSGWDLTQVLRAPGTVNHKYEARPRVQVISIEDRAYDPDELERTLPALPVETSKPTVRVERPAGPITTTDRLERIKDRMFDGPRGHQLRRLFAGDASDYRKDDGSPDWSAADLSFCSGAWYYSDGDAATVDLLWRQSGLATARPDPEKWDRVHYADGRTYGEGTIGAATGSKTYRDTHGYSAWEDPPRIQFTPKRPESAGVGQDGAATCPTDQPATLEDALALIAQLRQENDELRESNRDLLAWVDRTAGFVEELQACNATLSTKLSQVNALRAEDRRLAEAERKLGQVTTFSTNQKAAIRSFARIAASKASHGEAEAVITRGEIAESMGAHEATAGAALKSVFALDGVPIQRWNEPIPRKDESDPLRKIVTKYHVKGWENPADFIEAMVRIGAAQGERVKRYSQPRRCPEHPDAKVITQMVCGECGQVLLEPGTAPEADAAPIRANHSHREPPPPAVDDLRTKHERIARIGGCAPVADVECSDPVSLSDRRASVISPAPDAPRTVYVDGGAPDGRPEPLQSHPGKLPDYFRLPDESEIRPGRPDPTTWMYRPCCETTGMVRNLEGSQKTCLDCGATFGAQSVLSPPLKPPGWRCPAVLPDGRVCRAMERDDRPDGTWRCKGRGHESRDIERLPAAVAGGEE